MKFGTMTLTFSILLLFSILILILPPSHSFVPDGGPNWEERRTCVTSSDCRDPHKECLNGYCHCLPFYDDVHDLTKGLEDKCMKSFLANCNETEPCNTYKQLKCDGTGTCVCNDEDETHLEYDPYLNTCAAPPGERCDLHKFAGLYMVECVRNAKCKKDPDRVVDKLFFGKCECVKGFVPSGKWCVPEIGTRCKFHEDCGQRGMICKEDRCECDGERIYDYVTHECRLKHGMECQEGNEEERGRCVENAYCVPKGDSGWFCECDRGFHGDDRGECRNNEDEQGCGRVDDTRVFDKKRGRCSRKVGGSCRTQGPNQCVSHAFCGTGNRCQCFDEYRVTKDKMCEKGKEEEGEVKGGQGGYAQPQRVPDGASKIFGGAGRRQWVIIICFSVLVSMLIHSS